MITICCGENRDCAYCPDCGEKMLTVLWGLWKHCGAHAKETRKRADKQKKLLDLEACPLNNEHDMEEKRIQRAGRAERRALKWEGWRDELFSLLEKESANGTKTDV